MTVDGCPRGDSPPRIAPHLQIHRAGSDVVVVGEDGVTTVRGRAAAVLALLDRGGWPDGGPDGPAQGVTEVELRSVVEELRAAGLVDAGVHRGDTRGVFHRASSGRTVGPTSDVRVDVVDLGDPEVADAVSVALANSGAQISQIAPTCIVAIVQDHLDPRLQAVDRRSRSDGTPWLPVRARGVRQWVGPFIGAAGDGPCWECLATRAWAHRRAEEALQVGRNETGPLARRLPAHPATIGMMAHTVALEVDAWAHGVARPAQRGVVVHDQRTGSSDLHVLRRRPQCVGCGDPALQARLGQLPVELGAGPFDHGANDTSMEGYSHLVSPVTGVVRALADVPSPVPGVCIARTGSTPAARTVPLGAVRAWSRLGNGGSGTTSAAARSAALGEALERWCGQLHDDELRIRASRTELGEEAVDPREVLLVDPRQAADHRAWNLEHGPFNQIGPDVDDTEETDWTPLWSLRDGSRRLLPTAMLFHGVPGPSWALADSTGCAAGPTRDEAIRRGLLELVERDAVALWWYNRSALPGVAVDDEIRAAHRVAGREVWALDLTTDLEIPVVAAVSARAGRGDRVMVGFAADSDPSRAAERALRELTAGTGAVLDGAPGPTDPDTRRWIAEVDLDGEPWLRPHGRSRPTAIPGDVRALVDRLLRHGLDPMVLDQTRPDIGLPVVRTVVPGLRPMWTRFAPGRLFDVPVALGRHPVRTRYEDLNTRAVFL